MKKNWGKLGKNVPKMGTVPILCPHFIKKCGFDKSNPYIKTGKLG
jgi:hypothetical protein